jgi:hypothetical protein
MAIRVITAPRRLETHQRLVLQTLWLCECRTYFQEDADRGLNPVL